MAIGVEAAQGKSSYKNLPAEPGDHGLGRSRGGFTTKVHAVVDTGCRPTTLRLGPGQAGDNPMLAPHVMPVPRWRDLSLGLCREETRRGPLPRY